MKRKLLTIQPAANGRSVFRRLNLLPIGDVQLHEPTIKVKNCESNLLK